MFKHALHSAWPAHPTQSAHFGERKPAPALRSFEESGTIGAVDTCPILCLVARQALTVQKLASMMQHLQNVMQERGAKISAKCALRSATCFMVSFKRSSAE